MTPMTAEARMCTKVAPTKRRSPVWMVESSVPPLSGENRNKAFSTAENPSAVVTIYITGSIGSSSSRRHKTSVRAETYLQISSMVDHAVKRSTWEKMNVWTYSSIGMTQLKNTSKHSF